MRAPAGEGLRLVRSLLGRLRPHRRALGVVALLSLVGSGLSLAQPALVQRVIAAVGDGAPASGLVVGLVGVVLAAACINGLTTYLLPRVGLDVVLQARRGLAGHLLALPVARLDAQRIGDLMSRIGADTTLLQTAVTGGIIQIASGILVAVGALVAMLLVDALLLGVTVAFVLGAVVLILLVSGRVRTISREEQAHVGDMGAAVERALGAARTIKAARAEPREAAAIGIAATAARDAGLRAARLEALISPLASLATQGAFLAVLALGGARVASGALTVGDLVAFVLYLFLLVLPVAQVAQAVVQLQSGLAAMERIEEVMALPRESDGDVVGAAATPREVPGLSFRGVSFAYDGQPVLKEISFEVPAGTTTALVGPSGGGKSTLLSLVERFADPAAGAVLLDGIDLRELPRDVLRARIGYVEQDAPALAGSLRDNLRLAAPEATDVVLMAALEAVRLTGLVDRSPLGLDAPVGERGLALSGGERQRLAIARVLVASPPVLLLDEPTASLDAGNEEAFKRAIAMARRQRTILVVAHRLSTIVDSDQIVVVQDGRVRATGTHEQLLAADDLYRELATTQLIT